MIAEVFYPDGQHEILCSVPNYDFNWQTTYTFTTPPYLPAGTRMVVTGLHDNTKSNPNNPNPNAYVTWGQSTNDEMMHGWTDFVYAQGEGAWPTSRITDSSMSTSAEQAPHPSTTDQTKKHVAVLMNEPELPSSTPPALLRHIATQPEKHGSDVRTRAGWIPSFARLAPVFAILALVAFLILLRR